MFPFQYHDQWYSDCTTVDSSEKKLWCAVETSYQTERWGYCPVTCEYCLVFLWSSVRDGHIVIFLILNFVKHLLIISHARWRLQSKSKNNAFVMQLQTVFFFLRSI